MLPSIGKLRVDRIQTGCLTWDSAYRQTMDIAESGESNYIPDQKLGRWGIQDGLSFQEESNLLRIEFGILFMI